MSANLTELGKSFARHLRAEGKAARTIKLYGMSVQMFTDWLTARGTAPTLDAFTRDNIREWLADLSEDRGPRHPHHHRADRREPTARTQGGETPSGEAPRPPGRRENSAEGSKFMQTHATTRWRLALAL